MNCPKSFRKINYILQYKYIHLKLKKKPKKHKKKKKKLYTDSNIRCCSVSKMCILKTRKRDVKGGGGLLAMSIVFTF